MSALVPFAVVASRPEPSTILLTVSGDLDIATVPELRRHVDEEIESAPADRVVLDLSGTGFIDSTSIAELMRIDARLPQFVVRAPSRAVMRVFELMGLDRHFTIEAG